MAAAERLAFHGTGRINIKCTAERTVIWKTSAAHRRRELICFRMALATVSLFPVARFVAVTSESPGRLSHEKSTPEVGHDYRDHRLITFYHP